MTPKLFLLRMQNALFFLLQHFLLIESPDVLFVAWSFYFCLLPLISLLEQLDVALLGTHISLFRLPLLLFISQHGVSLIFRELSDDLSRFHLRSYLLSKDGRALHRLSVFISVFRPFFKFSVLK